VRAGDEIVVCGQLFHTGTPVVLWTDPGGYDAYRVENRFDRPAFLAAALAAQAAPASAPAKTQPAEAEAVARYGSWRKWRKHVPPEVLDSAWQHGWSLDRLRDHVDLFVLHYDVCCTSRRCFEVLHDERHLSVHFMLDLDGTIYQTLDLKERAWHAGSANDRSVGVEIANIGAYKSHQPLEKWYTRDADGRPRVTLPPAWGNGGLRSARPARSDPVHGAIHGQEYQQYDFTPEQYAALAKLTATLTRVLPRVRLEFPRDAAGAVLPRVLSEAELQAFSGVLGHYHLTKQKIDPGPALDWDRLQRDAQRALR
jgi:N-acetyl-anhydromuramyl-L-alanine amidase AmpD